MAITREHLFTTAWSLIFNLINDNVTDPTGKTKWLYSSLPDFKIKSDSNYPLIVIPNLNASDSIISINMDDTELRFTIEVYALSSLQLDEICENIYETIKSKTNELATSGLFYVKNISSSHSPIERDGSKLHLSVMEFSGKFAHSR